MGFSHGTKGEASERVVWERACAAERAVIDRFGVADVLSDLANAYQEVKRFQCDLLLGSTVPLRAICASAW
eukprot:1819196-Pyramimonas_sp.AAC.1